MPPIALVVVLLAAWEAYARSLTSGGFVLPAPSRIATALWDQRDLAIQHTTATLGEAAVGFAASLGLAILAAILMDLLPTVRRSVYPLLVGSQAVGALAVTEPGAGSDVAGIIARARAG